MAPALKLRTDGQSSCPCKRQASTWRVPRAPGRRTLSAAQITRRQPDLSAPPLLAPLPRLLPPLLLLPSPLPLLPPPLQSAPHPLANRPRARRKRGPRRRRRRRREQRRW